MKIWGAYQDAADEIMEYGALGYARGLTAGSGGNISRRCGDGKVLITASGVPLRRISEFDLLVVDLDGNVCRTMRDVRPSKETLFHLAIYRARTDVQCVYHLHPPFATAYAVCGQAVPLITCSASVNIGQAPLVGYAPAGSQALSDIIEEAVRGHDASLKALVLDGHGIVTFSSSLEAAYNTAEVLEDTARIALYRQIIASNRQIVPSSL